MVEIIIPHCINKVKVNGQRLETVTSFKYLGSVITNEGSKPEILSSIAQALATLTRLKPVWNDRSIFLSAPRCDRCAPLSHSQQSSKEEYKPRK